MTVEEIIKHIEDWAPPEAGWENDNVGLQVGDKGKTVTNVLLALDMNQVVLENAVRKKCNLIITHHPFLFKPLRTLNLSSDPKSQIIQKAILNGISIFSAHTNLDFTKEGVSFELAKTLKLKNIDFLLKQSNNQFKLVVFVPFDAVDEVSSAIFDAGGGVIGDYNKCSFRLEGKGTFEGSQNSNPAVGKRHNFETIEEFRLEVLVNKWNLDRVIKRMLEVHPYEEPAYDVIPLANINNNYGEGAIGELEKSMSKNEFLKYVSKCLKVKALRYANIKKGRIKKVAVCGGSGSSLVNTAVKAGADAFVTADVKYHTFQDAENKILLIDAGHYETEVPSLNIVKEKIEKLVKENNADLKVFKYAGSTNPVSYFNI